ncbi:MAG TPA: LuxR C-terminal-related transcriptional regulator [Ktedonobacterales bacterium]|nr:LuxR C-terminal-related transcriptional regulator [Ktedonobacterales bacterium]
MTAPDLLVTKCTIPPVRGNLLPRAPLIEWLNQSGALPLVLLSAGAGFGKTTLLSAWASQHSRPVAWLSLDLLDNDPLGFWSAVLSALRTRFPTVGEAAWAQIQAAQPLQMTPWLSTLINDLAEASEEIVLILDDYHVIEEPSIHASLQFLLDHAPARLHLVLSSRIDPPLALSRLRARGQLAELRDTDLRVSEQEGARFLQQVMGVHLGAEDEHRLAQRTEGWLVGLQLAALSLAHHVDPGAWVATLSGNQRLLLDYFQEEILAHQTPAVRRFLLRVSILPRMHASLCQAVTGNAVSQEVLEMLERTHLFVIPLDEQRQWYRLHDLFREALLARLQATQPALVPTLYARAARWYEQAGLLPEAVEASLSAGAFHDAARLIERCIDQQSFRNAYHTLCRWLEHVPEELLHQEPALSFWYALSTMFTSLRSTPASGARVEPLLHWAEQGFEAQGEPEHLGEALELHAELAFFQGDLAGALALARQATPLLSERSLMAATHPLPRGLDQFLAGYPEAAWNQFLEGRRRAERFGSLTGTVSASLLLAEVCLARGELHQAERYCRQTLAAAEEDPERFQQQLMTATGDREPFFASWAYHSLARLAYEWNDLATAQHHLTQAQALGADSAGGVHLLTSGGLIQVRLLHRRGETEEALHLLEAWEQQTRFPWALRAIRACQARLHLALGHLSAVVGWSRARADFFGFPVQEHERELPYVQQEEEALLVVRLSLAQEEPLAALQEVGRWKAQAGAQGRTQALLELLMLEALAHQANRALQEARASLLQALRLAQPEQHQRVFLDEGPGLATLLKSALKETQAPALAAYARGLLVAFEQEQTRAPAASPAGSSPLLEPLTPQEQRVLRLLAEGASNQQIADQLVISLVTVKKHMTNLLGKLGATNRTQAIVHARDYGLL